MSDFDLRSYERKRTSVLLGESLARLSETLKKGNAVLERRGTRAVRNRLVREMRFALAIYRTLVHHGEHAQPHHLAIELEKHEDALIALVPLPSRRPNAQPQTQSNERSIRPLLRLVGGTAIAESQGVLDGRDIGGDDDAA